MCFPRRGPEVCLGTGCMPWARALNPLACTAGPSPASSGFRALVGDAYTETTLFIRVDPLGELYFLEVERVWVPSGRMKWSLP